tara:strand:- start:329 stop:712 length:384 start_codon:yes stop_codon:yes gene_type:complete
MKVEYEGRTYETEPSGETIYCKNCGKKLPENWHMERIRVEDEVSEATLKLRDIEAKKFPYSYKSDGANFHHEDGRKLYMRTYGYGWESFFCTLRCGYSWACRHLRTREALENANSAEHQRMIKEWKR